uniref:Dihydrolipoyl dehydrogenase n=2 Tax=Candidatus Bipolaricaulota TaxID=67810 RepID=H5SDK2_9BACT|nr:dihydrolipoamide dehydrogenase [uncultured Acetothermia bacterium]BAL60268.1 dihydrolipoamide dehydrogenase [Candidatus Acetothermum autotrophicum]
MVVGEIAVGTDLLIVGGGPGGYVAAIRAAQLGKDVTLVEKDELGGICLNVGCIPSKALIYAAYLYEKIKRAQEFGISAQEVHVNLERLQAWKESVVKRLTGGVKRLCEGNGVTVIKGKATFISPKKCLVESEHGTQTIEFKDCIIATGAVPITIPGFEVDGEIVLDSTGALALKKLPESLIVIGGGYIGLELGMVYAKFGSKVTIVEMLENLLPGTDPELTRLVARKAKELKMDVYLKSQAKELKKGRDGAHLTVQTQEGEVKLSAEKILVSVGRRPNTPPELGLERVGVQPDPKGFLKTDAQMRTSVPHIYAIGDVAGPPLLAHKASHEGLVAAEAICGHKSAADWQTVPAVIFTDPEIAYAGLSEAEAQQAGYKTVTGKFPFAALGRALTMGETEGFIKIIADAETKVVLGVQIVGPEASTLISEAVLAIEMGATLEDLALSIHPHPTLPEGLMEAAEAALGKAIHILTPHPHPAPSP